MESSALGFLKGRLSPRDFARLEAIRSDAVLKFVSEYVELCNPASVYVSASTPEDLQFVRNSAVVDGEESRLKVEGHTAHFESYYDQGRDREHTLVLVPGGASLGPGIRTGDRLERIKEVRSLLGGIMAGRRMFVAFYCLGPIGSVFSIPCVQLTDSSFVVHSENILYRQGYEEFLRQGAAARPFKFVHSEGELDERKTCKNLDKRRIYIDLDGEIVYTVNTQYGGNSIGLKKLAMRLAIKRASKEGWLTEHMLVMGVNGPAGRRTYFTGAFPSMCGKTSTAMLEGEKIVGDDIAYLRRVDGRVRAVNVEKGVFGIIQGINPKDDSVQWKVLHNPGEIIFSNVLVTPDDGVFWDGMGGPQPPRGKNFSGEWWPGKKDEKGKEIPVSHLNARFTVSLDLFSNLDPVMDDAAGVRVGAIVYGGRDSDTCVPVEESLGWDHGIITFGACLESETTAATLGKEGVREFNPMSNLDFLSIPVGRYVEGNIRFGQSLEQPPRIFGVNYFLRSKEEKFLNDKTDKRVWFKWMELRIHDDVGVIETPTGRMPLYADLRRLFADVLGKGYALEDYEVQFTLRVAERLAKLDRVEHAFRGMDHVPTRLYDIIGEQRARLLDARSRYGDYIKPSQLS
ncbi:MAG: phosphoenolpyruvate carboxykinase (GTP) [Nitrososphaerales archaeon]